MTTESLTYPELGKRLGCSPEAARSLSRRLRLVRKPGNDGRARVIVDLAEIQYRPVATRSPDDPRADIDALKAQIEQLQSDLVKLETEKNCLEASVAEHRADFEHERNRCDKLIAETLVLNKVAMSARETAARLEGEASGSNPLGHIAQWSCVGTNMNYSDRMFVGTSNDGAYWYS